MADYVDKERGSLGTEEAFHFFSGVLLLKKRRKKRVPNLPII